MRILLVRHGAAAIGREADPIAGPPLSALGREQALAAGLHILNKNRERLAGVYASPLFRARETAEIIAGALGNGAHAIVPGFEGLTEDELRAGSGLGLRRLTDIQTRAWSALLELRQGLSQDGAAVVVSHDVTIRAIVCQALSIPLPEIRRFRVEIASITTLDFRPQRTILASLNDTCHLSALDRSTGK